MFKKLAVAAAFTAASLSAAAPASADPIVDGCWGAVLTFCDPELRVTVYEVGSKQYPVCTGSCRYVSVPTVERGAEEGNICLDYTTTSGSQHSDCVAPSGFEGFFYLQCGVMIVEHTDLCM